MGLQRQEAKALHIQGQVVVNDELGVVVEKHKHKLVLVEEMGKVVGGKVQGVVRVVEVNVLHKAVEMQMEMVVVVVLYKVGEVEVVLYKVGEMVVAVSGLVVEVSGQEVVVAVISRDKQVEKALVEVVVESDEAAAVMVMVAAVSCSSKV
jgi:hypothetical protein